MTTALDRRHDRGTTALEQRRRYLAALGRIHRRVARRRRP
jgi:hypothetical protein